VVRASDRPGRLGSTGKNIFHTIAPDNGSPAGHIHRDISKYALVDATQ